MDLPPDRYATVQDHRVRYWDEGTGAPIVLIHGLANSVLTWRKNIEPLSREFRVIALDLPGHGLSDMPMVRFDLPKGAAFLAAFLDEVGVDRAHLAGNSMGGAIALELALTRPERAASVTLADSAGLGPGDLRPATAGRPPTPWRICPTTHAKGSPQPGPLDGPRP